MSIVNICGIPHTVSKQKDSFGTNEYHFGEIDYKKCEITLADDLPPKLEEETMFHEMLHGIFFHIGRDDLSQNENLIDALANAMMQSFKIKYYTPAFVPGSEKNNKDGDEND